MPGRTIPAPPSTRARFDDRPPDLRLCGRLRGSTLNVQVIKLGTRCRLFTTLVRLRTRVIDGFLIDRRASGLDPEAMRGSVRASGECGLGLNYLSRQWGSSWARPTGRVCRTPPQFGETRPLSSPGRILHLMSTSAKVISSALFGRYPQIYLDSETTPSIPLSRSTPSVQSGRWPIQPHLVYPARLSTARDP